MITLHGYPRGMFVPRLVSLACLLAGLSHAQTALACETQNGQPCAPLPFDVQSRDGAISARTGIGTLRDYNAKSLSRKIEEAKPALPSGIQAPPPPPASPTALDVWTSLGAEGLESDAAGVKAKAGADYKLSPSAVTGISLEHSAAAADADKASAYVRFKAMPHVSIDALTSWERTDSQAEPSQDKRAAAIAPRVKRKFQLDGGNTVEPYITTKHAVSEGVSVSGQTDQDISVTNSAGAGVTFAKPDSYSLSVSADVESAGSEAPPAVNSRLQFKLPLD